MLKSFFMLVLFLSGVTAFLAGAWPDSLSRVSPDPQVDFVPQPISLDTKMVGTELTGALALDKAIMNLTGTDWIKVTIHQTMSDAASCFVADGCLQRGPNHCARLELNVKTGHDASRWLLVSDGNVVAVERTLGASKSAVECERISAADKEAYLAARGCGGPRTLLHGLKACLRDLKIQTGLLNGKPVVQVHGELEPNARVAVTTEPIRCCRVFLDASTLWPIRVDWQGASRKTVMRIEFRNPEVNQTLSHEDCVRAFSYQPQS